MGCLQFLEEEDGNVGSMLGFSFGAQNFSQTKKPDNLAVEVECTLNELYCGCAKTITYTKQSLNNDGITTSHKTLEKQKFLKILKFPAFWKYRANNARTIEIKPGYTCGQVITLEKEGHEVAGVNPCKKFHLKYSEVSNQNQLI